MPDLQILPECYADTALVRQFVADSQIVVHIFGIPNVAKEMQQSAEREDGSTRIGFVDNDKRVPPYLLKFNTISDENKVHVKWNEITEQRLIVIDKAIETFLLWNAQQVSVSVVDYGFSTDIKLFGKALKTSSIGSNADYLRLLTDLYERNAPGFLTLQRVITELIEG